MKFDVGVLEFSDMTGVLICSEFWLASSFTWLLSTEAFSFFTLVRSGSEGTRFGLATFSFALDLEGQGILQYA